MYCLPLESLQTNKWKEWCKIQIVVDIVVSIKNLLAEEMINLSSLSRRCDKAWENELQATFLPLNLWQGWWCWFVWRELGSGGSPASFPQDINFGGPVPCSPLDTFTVLLVKEHLNFYSCRAGHHNGQTQLSLFMWRPLKVYKRKGTDQRKLDAKSL